MKLSDRIEAYLGTPQPVCNFVFRTAALSLIPTVLIVQVLRNAGLIVEEAVDPSISQSRWILLRFVCIPLIIPWFETLIMVVVFAILRGLRVRGEATVWVSAAIWAAFHWNAQNPFFMISGFWIFFVFSKAYLHVAQHSRHRAMLTVGLAHTLHNVAALAFSWPRR